MPMNILESLLEEIAAMAASRPDREILMLFRRRMSKLEIDNPDAAMRIAHVISSAGGLGATRSFQALDKLPIDQDSGMELVYREECIKLEEPPILNTDTKKQVNRFITERERVHDLRRAGISPPSSLALMGKPGTGKTTLARWMAARLKLPFLSVNIAGIVTSYLGQTGQNLKKVLDRAKLEPCLILLDEFDALGYHRGDDSDVGEMRRIVTVLLQEIENWPEHSIIIAATNMPEQVDPAFRRRFSRWVDIPLPDFEIRLQILKHYYGTHKNSPSYLEVAAAGLAGASGADLKEFVRRVRTAEIVENLSPRNAIWSELEPEIVDRIHEDQDRIQFAKSAREVDEKQFSYRSIGAILGISHTTARRLVSQ